MNETWNKKEGEGEVVANLSTCTCAHLFYLLRMFAAGV